MEKAQVVLKKVYDFFEENNLVLDYDKIQVLCVRPKHKLLPKRCLKDPLEI